jgi:predicted nucleic acid-binding protein
MIVILDASAAMGIALNRADAAFLKKMVLQSDVVLAPDLYVAEVTNTFWKYGTFSGLSADLCEKGIAFCLDLVDDFISAKSLCAEALAEALRIRHPAYDVFYLIAARRNNAFLITLDKHLIVAAKEMKVKVRKPER